MINNIKARTLIKALEQDGFILKRTSGSHRIYKHKNGRRAVIAYHHLGETIPLGSLSSIIKDTGWSDEDLIRLGIKK